MDCIDWINKKLREGAVTQEKLRAAIEEAEGKAVSQPTISRILTRKTPNPGYKTINALIRACGGDPDAWMNSAPITNNSRTIESATLAELSEELARRLKQPTNLKANSG